MGKTPSHSLLRQAGEGERKEMQPEPGSYGAKGRIHLVMGGVEPAEDCQGLETETVVETRKGSHLWHLLSLKAGVSVYPIDRSHMELLQQLPGQRLQLRYERETGSAGRAVRGPAEQVWHLSGRVES